VVPSEVVTPIAYYNSKNSDFYVNVYWLRNMNQVSTTKQ